ncbi:MAG: ImmA/IrrE family metallo-endopeptidase [Kineothrix sp.]
MIKRTVNRLCELHHTRNPYVLASAMDILVIHEDLGQIGGYYNKLLRMKQIHINHHLSESGKLFTCAHELGHAILHPNENTPFLKQNTFLSVHKLENEANLFAAELLIPDEIILENHTLTLNQLSRLLGYREKLIELKLKSLSSSLLPSADFQSRK